MVQLSAFQSSLITIFIIALQSSADHEGCSTPKPNERDFLNAQHAEKLLFGKTVNDIDEEEVSAILHGKGTLGIAKENTQLQLTGIPIVYHILPYQHNGSTLRPSLTKKQAEWATNITNHLFRIYDRRTKTSIQFASFTFNGNKDFKVHRDFRSRLDCDDISEVDLRTIVKRTADWKFKMHVVVCESNRFSGRASFPDYYTVENPLHNLVLVDHRAMACYDESGNFLCNKYRNGAQVSKTRWWRTRSVVVAHEFGHLFGLYHTFEGSCTALGDGVFDTPAAVLGQFISDCPGLLPYDKDRDLFSGSSGPNIAKNASQCGGEGKLCGQTCAACCDKQGGECIFYKSEFESVSQQEIDNPVCCPGDENGAIVVEDSCPTLPGIDPHNNVMGYSPDYCVNDFTPGQMLRMTAQIIQYKTYLYCNYGNIVDAEKCSDVPCSTRATSPNCV